MNKETATDDIEMLGAIGKGILSSCAARVVR